MPPALRVVAPLVLLMVMFEDAPTIVSTDAELLAVFLSVPVPPEKLGLEDTVIVFVADVGVLNVLLPRNVTVTTHCPPGGAFVSVPVKTS